MVMFSFFLYEQHLLTEFSSINNACGACYTITNVITHQWPKFDTG